MAQLELVARGKDEEDEDFSNDKGFNSHNCDTTPKIEGHSSTVFVEGYGVARDTDQMEKHEKKMQGERECSHHDGTDGDNPQIAAVNTTVFIEGLNIARMQDPIVGKSPESCGNIATITQSTVLAGE